MVEKIDRPKPPEPWTVKATAATKDDQQGGAQQQSSNEPDDEFTLPGTVDSWNKFHATQESRFLMQIDRAQVRHLWFLKASMKRQLALVECDMEMLDGKLYRGVQYLLPRLEDFFQFKGYAVGQEIAVSSVMHTPIAEVSVPSARARSVTPTPQRSPVAPPPAKLQWWQLWNPHTQQLRPQTILLYAVFLLTLIVVIMLTV